MVIGSIAVGIVLFLLSLYCCLVQGKREDEVIDRLCQDMEKNGVGKDDE